MNIDRGPIFHQYHWHHTFKFTQINTKDSAILKHSFSNVSGSTKGFKFLVTQVLFTGRIFYLGRKWWISFRNALRFLNCYNICELLLFYYFIIIIIYLMLIFVTYKWIINNLANTMIVKITTIFSIANLSRPDTLI